MSAGNSIFLFILGKFLFLVVIPSKVNYIDDTYRLVYGLHFSKIRFFCCHTNRSKPILQALQIFILIDYKKSIESWCLQEDDLTFI